MLKKDICFVIIGILKMLAVNLNLMFLIGCHAILMIGYELKNIAILSQKDVDYRCVLWGISKNEAINMLNTSAL